MPATAILYFILYSLNAALQRLIAAELQLIGQWPLRCSRAAVDDNESSVEMQRSCVEVPADVEGLRR